MMTLSLLKILNVLCLMNLLLSFSQCENIFVWNKPRKNQKLEKVCGSTKDDPCRTINEAVKIAKTNYEITIMASELPYHGCPIQIRKPLALKGMNGKPVIDCAGKDAVIFDFSQSIKNKSNIKLDVSNLRIQNSKTGFSFPKSSNNVYLRLTDIEFRDNEIDVSWRNSHLCHLVLTNVLAIGSSGHAVDIYGCNKTTIELHETTFLGKYFQVVSSEKSSILDVNMDGVEFNMSNRARIAGYTKDVQTSSPMYVVTALEQSAITVKSSKFLNHFGESQSMVNITGFQKKLTKVASQYISRININFNDTTFVNNTVNKGVGGAISFHLYNKLTKKGKHQVVFNVSKFVDNSALRGGAMWFSEWVRKTVLLNDSTFINNKAHGASDGSGGALYGLGGKYLIRYCKFDGNTAIKSGGSLYLMNEQITSMRLFDSTFKNKRRWSRNEGDVVYLNDVQTEFRGNVVFDIISSNGGESIILYEGRPRVLYMSNATKFICPTGYNYEEPKYVLKLRKRNKGMAAYHIFAFTCQPCQDMYYSSTRGFRQQNGTERRGKCRKCPQGASCNGTIRARANFWGRLVGNEVEMIPCPKDYCCNREPCESYDTCHSHRTGTLCGHCVDGYTEGMSSPKCFPNEKCNKASWLWPIGNVLVIFLIFCFHQEIINKLVKWSLWTDEGDETEKVEYERGKGNHNENFISEESNSLLLSDGRRANINQSVPPKNSRPDFSCIPESSNYNNCGGYIKVFYYFYQASLLIRLSSYVSNSSFPNWIITILTPVLNFQFTSIWDCAGENMRPAMKVFLKNSLPYWVLGFSLLMYIIYRIVRYVKRINIDDEPGFQARSFPTRLLGTIVQVILLSYVAQTQLAVQLLNCVKVGNQRVLYIDGSVSCYKSYQGIVWCWFVLSIAAFPIGLLLGRNLLISGRISVKEFILSCFFSLAFLIRWGYKYFRHYHANSTWPQNPDVRDAFKEKIKYILQYPYNSPEDPNKPSIIERLQENWEAVLLFRRLILVCVFIFVESFLLRAYFFFIASVLFLLSHTFVHPYKNDNVNKLDTVSLALIVVISGLGITEATYNNSGQLIPYDVEMLQTLQDWYLALLPTVLLLVFLFPRAKFHFLSWTHRSRKLEIPTDDDAETVLPNPFIDAQIS